MTRFKCSLSSRPTGHEPLQKGEGLPTSLLSADEKAVLPRMMPSGHPRSAVAVRVEMTGRVPLPVDCFSVVVFRGRHIVPKELKFKCPLVQANVLERLPWARVLIQGPRCVCPVNLCFL